MSTAGNDDDDSGMDGVHANEDVIDLINSDNDNSSGIEYEMDPAAMATTMNVDTDLGDEAGLGDITIKEDCNKVNVRGLSNVKKAAINAMAINHDVIAYSKAEVEKLNLKEVQVRKREQKLRKKALRNDVMAAVTEHKDGLNEGGECDDDNHIMQSLKRHEEAVLSNGVDV